MKMSKMAQVLTIITICGLLLQMPNSTNMTKRREVSTKSHVMELLDTDISPWHAMGHVYTTMVPPSKLSDGAQRAVDERSGAMRVLATVSTYQAVAGQTDDDSTITASGLDLAAGHGRIVAHPTLPFGTKVLIRGKVYRVQDRTNSRFGFNHFDVLTNGKNFHWTKEPVKILR